MAELIIYFLKNIQKMNYKQLKEKLKATEKSNKYLKKCNKYLKKCNKENRGQVIKFKKENNDLYKKLLK